LFQQKDTDVSVKRKKKRYMYFIHRMSDDTSAPKRLMRQSEDTPRTLVADSPPRELVEALISAWQAVNDQIVKLSRRLLTIAREDQTVKRLMTAPGVGVLVALTYTSVVDNPERFTSPSSVGAYVGLTPLPIRRG
jgi:transposase